MQTYNETYENWNPRPMLPPHPVQRKSRAGMWAIISVSVVAFFFMITTFLMFLAFIGAEENFMSQIDVTEQLVEAVDSAYEFDFETANMHLEEAQQLQQKVLDNLGVDRLDVIR